MTRDEVKREHKEQEGDPHHKAERQRAHRELGEQRMLADVRKADFVVTNPDHVAVAIRYDREGDAAPVVVAKGERLLAEKIKEVAREAGVPVFRDVALARSLREVEEGDEIPEALFEAVAEILRVLYAMGTGERTAPGVSEDASAPGDPSRRPGVDREPAAGRAPPRPPPGAWWWRA
jgi:flagellar biosynthetic protein FlhB